ncbi:YbjN domain-containing protein [Pseudomonas sp. D47]|uniref:YbjN domain-containing protein n=1 Tax=Pseudomonas sp. D47 TaxID=3159447 RepID=UPI00387B37C8
MSTSGLITQVTTEKMTHVLQEAGYRVNQSEQNGAIQLLTASQGIGYAVRFGNRGSEAGAYVDFTYSCALRIQGALPAGMTELWNATRRFARLSVQSDFLVMELDVTVAAGVSLHHLRGNLELWDRLLQEFIVYLREYSHQVAHLEAEATGSKVPLEPQAAVSTTEKRKAASTEKAER